MSGSDLITRLRALADGQHDDLSVGAEAADEIERLTAERDEAASRCEKLRELADQSAYESGVAFRRLAQAQERRAMARKAERARCISVIRRLHDLLPVGEQRRSKPGLRDAIIAIELLDQSIGANETQHTA